MTNALVTAQMALEGMIAIAANDDFALVDETANRIFIRKTIAARAAIQTVEKAMELVGGSALYRNVGLERSSAMSRVDSTIPIMRSGNIASRGAWLLVSTLLGTGWGKGVASHSRFCHWI